MINVLSIEVKQTSTGKDYKAVTLDGKVLGTEKFNIFQFHSRYKEITQGLSLSEDEFEQDGKYIKLKDPNAKPRGHSNVGIALAQERKAENIQHAQENKDYAIRVSSTARDATLITVALLEAKAIEPKEFKNQWAIIRSWLWENWSVEKPENIY
jgi:hypothetical protein